MRDRNELREFLTSKAANIAKLSTADREAAVAAIIKHAESVPAVSGANPFAERPPENPNLGFGLRHEKIGTISIKGRNYFVSWKKLLLSGSSIPMNYVDETLSAMTILMFLVTGAVHIFDQIDAEILAVIHKNASLLPLSSGAFHDQISGQLPKEINRDLFMKRVSDLAKYRAISLDNDLLAITEPVVLLGGRR